MAKNKKEFGTVVDDTIQQAEDIREVQRSADRVGEEQQQQAAQQEQQAPPVTHTANVPEASASGNTAADTDTADTDEKPTTAPAKSKDKRTKLTDQGMTKLVITGSYKKHTMTVYEPLYQLMTTMAKAWNANIQDVAALVMMEGVRDLKGKDRAKINKLLKNFVSADTDKEIEEMRTAYLREQTAALLAQAGLTPDDLKALANGKS